MKTKRTLMALSLILALILGLVNLPATNVAAEGENVEMTFSWWGGDERHNATQEAVDLFMEENPEITVKTNFGAWSGWEEKLSAQFSSGTAEDMNQINWNWIEAYSSDGSVFVDINDYADIIDLSQFPESTLEACTVAEKLQGVPISMTGRILYWNEATWNEAGLEVPTTMEEIIAAGDIFANELGDDYYPMTMGEYDRMIFMVYYLESVYGKPWVENGELQYSAEEIAEGLQLFLDLEEAHVIPTLEVLAGDGADSLDKNPRWMEGNYGGLFEWDSAATKMRDSLVNPDDFTVGTFPTDMGEHQGGFTKVSMAFAISESADEAQRTASAKLIDFLLNNEQAIVTLATTRGVPNSAKAIEVLKAQEEETGEQYLDPDVVVAHERIMDWTSFPLDPYFEAAALKSSDGAYYDVHSGISYGDYSVEEAAEILIEEIAAALEG